MNKIIFEICSEYKEYCISMRMHLSSSLIERAIRDNDEKSLMAYADSYCSVLLSSGHHEISRKIRKALRQIQEVGDEVSSK